MIYFFDLVTDLPNQNLKAEDMIVADAVHSVRPQFWLEPKYVEQIIGKKTMHDTNFPESKAIT
jgi:sialic acid synthase SpsE